MLDFSHPDAGAEASIEQMTAQAMTSAGVVENITLRENTESGGVRVTFELDPAGQETAELRVDLLRGGQPAAEVWVSRWTS